LSVPSPFPQEDHYLLERFQSFLNRHSYSQSTLSNYIADMRSYLKWADEQFPALLGQQLKTLETGKILSYKSHLQAIEQCAPATIKRRTQSLKKFGSFALAGGFLAQNPAEEITLEADTPAAPATLLTKEDAAKLLTAVEEGRSSIKARDLAIICLMTFDGLKIKDLLQLTIENFVFDYPGLHIEYSDPLTGAVRKIFLAERTRKALLDYLAIRTQDSDEKAVFLSQEGKPLSARTIQRIISNYSKRAGFKGVNSQTLRRGVALRVYEDTRNINAVAERLGHKNVSSTQHFLESLQAAATIKDEPALTPEE
jgi:integrase/recombinase XerC